MSIRPSGTGFDPVHFWQVGVIVQDIDAAMREMTTTMGLTWGEVKTNRMHGDEQHVVFSRQGPPYFELIQGPADTYWDARQGSRLDHLAYWVPDIAAERARVEGAGAPVVFDGTAYGLPITYHALKASGLRLEFVDVSFKETLRANRDLEDVG